MEICMSIDRLYITIAFLWLLVGMVFGVYIGINGITEQANTHAHIGLLGFVVSALFGLFYRAWPSMAESRLVWPQLGIYQIGTALLVIGKYQVDVTGDSAVVAPGSLVVVLGTALMAWIFLTKAKN
jgi:peptidoglycan/LPS O-acetylase OafA/YrhL